MSWTIANLLIHSIHDASAVQATQSDQESVSDGSVCSPQAPSEPGSKVDEELERNIYPITWRVIGGGVMMGGESTYFIRVLTLCPLTCPKGEACPRYKDGACPESDDCPYAHPWDGTLGRIQAFSYAH
jgi:hypothetical protein